MKYIYLFILFLILTYCAVMADIIGNSRVGGETDFWQNDYVHMILWGDEHSATPSANGTIDSARWYCSLDSVSGVNQFKIHLWEKGADAGATDWVDSSERTNVTNTDYEWVDAVMTGTVTSGTKYAGSVQKFSTINTNLNFQGFADSCDSDSCYMSLTDTDWDAPTNFGGATAGTIEFGIEIYYTETVSGGSLVMFLK